MRTTRSQATRTGRHRTARPILAAVLAATLAACGTDTEGATGTDASTSQAAPRLELVASTSVIADVLRAVAGPDATVEELVPPGVDVHGFRLSAADAVGLREADLVVVGGLGLESAFADALDAAEQDGTVVHELFGGLDDVLTFGAHDEHAEDEHAEDEHGHDDHAEDEDVDDTSAGDDAHAHEEGVSDPHVWHDPVRVADAIPALVDALQAVSDTDDDAVWEERGDAYAQELLAVHGELVELYASVPAEQRVLVTNHEALGYLADRYGFTIAEVVVPGNTVDGGPGAGAFATLVDRVRDLGARAIFSENVGDDRLAQALADEVGRDVVVVELVTDALAPAGEDADSLLGLMRHNARLIVEALSASDG